MSNSFGSWSEEAAGSELGVAEDKADGGICAKAFAASGARFEGEQLI